MNDKINDRKEKVERRNPTERERFERNFELYVPYWETAVEETEKETSSKRRREE